MTVRADLHAAIRWTKRALGMLAHQQTGTGPASAPTSSVSLDACVPRLEAVLLVADLFEQAGHIDSALTYTSEAVSIARISPRAINSIVLLHSLRIWYRAGSLRLISCVSDLLNDEMDLGLPEEKQDDVTDSVRAATKCLANLLNIGIDPEMSSKAIHASIPSLASTQVALQYRHVRYVEPEGPHGLSWDYALHGPLPQLGGGSSQPSLLPRVYRTLTRGCIQGVARDKRFNYNSSLLLFPASRVRHRGRQEEGV